METPAETPYLGELYALCSAFFYGASAVAINKNAESGRPGNGAYLSVLLTALMAGGLWLIMGRSVWDATQTVWISVGFFVLAGLLANISGRVFMFRAVELVGAIEIGILRRMIPVFAAFLAILFLGERITASVSIGFFLVFSGVATVILGGRPPRAAAGATGKAGPSVTVRSPENLRHGRIFGTVSSASYGGAYVSRKFAMDGLPDPLLGTFIGAITGLVGGGTVALFSRYGRAEFLSLFRRPSVWQLVAAVTVSLGQIYQFFALKYTSVTAVAIIGSIEMFIAAWLSAAFLKSEKKPGPVFVLASCFALAGTVVIALG